MNRRIALLLLIAAFTACQRAPEPPPPKPQPKPAGEIVIPRNVTKITDPVEDLDGDNLLNIAYGAAVVSRTGELNLESSAVHMMDGMSPTGWTCAPGDASQTIVFSLGAPSRIERLGVTTGRADHAPAKVSIDGSSDARTWREITTIVPIGRGTKIVEVPPVEARFIRVRTSDPKDFISIVSLHVLGREVRPPVRQSFDGCWTINTRHGRLVQRGARVTGVFGDTNPTYVDGGIDGRAARLLWMRGPNWGYATATLSADGRAISAITFHEEPRLQQNGEAWLGDRCDAAPNTLAAPLPPAAFLKRIGHWTLSGVVFDREEHLLDEPSRATLDDAATLIRSMPAQRFRIIAREFRNNDVQDNRRRTEMRVAAVRAALAARGVDVNRITFEGKGSEGLDAEMPSAVQRMLWSRIDLERVR